MNVTQIYSNCRVSVESVRSCYSPFVDFVLEDVFEAMSKVWGSCGNRKRTNTL